MGDDEWSFYNVKEERSAAAMQLSEHELASASPSSDYNLGQAEDM